MNMLKKSLALLLTLCMLISVVPLTVFAADTTDGTAAASETGTDFYRILHLDCGRKYFTKDWIIALINEMAAAGYNQLQLAFGNDGLRFLLDDMSVTVDGTTYSSEDVTAGVQLGNENYYDAGDVNELTETEMDEIIAHATSKDIEIVPHYNMPGHMDATLDAIEYVGISDAHFTGYTTSVRSLNLNNSAAVSFTKALLQKYVDYFAENGVKFFHIGADEFANDAYYGTMGFAAMGSTLYAKFVTFVEDCAAIVKEANMTPRAWNDGFYYGSYTTEIDTDIQLTYWSCGWGSGYDLEAASSLAKNYQLINTNGDYYYILGVNDCYTSDSTTTHVGYDYTAAEGFSNTTFMGSTVSDPVGSMFCVWSDLPGAETETEVAKYIRPIMRVIAARMQDSNGYEVDSIVAGGFNADGTINVVEPEEPEIPVTPEEPENVTLTDNGISVTAPGLTDLTVTEADAPSISGAAKIKAWNLTPAATEGNYTGEATVALPIPAEWNSALVRAFVVNADNTIETIIGNVTNSMYEFVMPHFSVGGLYELETTAEEDISGLPDEYKGVVSHSTTESENYWALVTNGYKGIETGKKYLIASTNSDTVRLLSKTGSRSSEIPVSNSQITSNIGTEYQFTFEGNNTSWTIKDNGGTYLYPTATRSNRSWSYDLTTQSSTATTVTINGNSYVRIYRILSSGNNSTYSYIIYNSSFKADNENYNLYLFEEVSIPGGTVYNVSTTGINALLNTIPTAQGLYTDETWNALQSAKTAAETAINGIEVSYEVEADANAQQNAVNTAALNLYNAWQGLKEYATFEITIKYVVTGNDTPIKTEPRTVSEKDTSVTVESFNANNKFYVVENTTLAITPATVKEYTVTVTETEEDLSSVAPLTVEYWITNQKVIIDNATSIEISATSVYSENGTNFDDRVPANDGAIDNPKVLWKGWLLPTGYHQEADANGGLDMTINENGNLIQKIRYWNKSWQYTSDAVNWIDIESSDQIVAYYMQQTNVTEEVTTNVVDWAQDYAEWKAGVDNGWFWDGYVENGSKYVFLDFAVVYEDGTQSPASFPTDDTWFFHFDGCSETNPRVLNPFSFSETSEYEIWKITVTDGTSSGYESASTFTSTYDNETETIVWDESMNGEPFIAALSYTANCSGKLVRIYVRAVETEDSLTVIYYDEKFGDTLVEYNVIVPNGSDFNNGIVEANSTIPATMPAFDNTARLDATGYGIVNALGKTQNFRTDLTQVPEAVGKYNNDLYTYTGSVVSADGLTITHYYIIDTDVLSPNYVADFGLPLTFELTDVVGANQESVVKNVTVNERTRYGTLSYNNGTFTYTPTSILQNIDVLTIHILFDGESSESTTNVGVTPATTVYYDDSFIGTGSGWSRGGTAVTVANQTAEEMNSSEEKTNKKNNYGYDPAYASVSGASHGTYLTTQTIGATTSFEFTGTGIQVFANATNETGYVSAKITDANGAIIKVYMVDTVVDPGDTSATSGHTGSLYGLPIISIVDVTGLDHGTYTVTLTKIMDTDPVYIDGIRVFGTIVEPAKGTDNTNNSMYKYDLEDYPDFYELRDQVLSAFGVSDNTSVDYKTMVDQVYSAVAGAAALITDESVDYANSTPLQDLLDNGPKNELYLYAGQTLTFKVTTSRVMQLGLKAPAGSANFKITVTPTGGTAKTLSLTELKSTVDMFYTLADKPSTETEYTVSIKVGESSNILSVTLLKICDDPNAAFVPLTIEDIETILAPDAPTADASLTVNITNRSGKVMKTVTLTATSVAGETHTFTEEEILAAISDVLGKDYIAARGSSIDDVEVVYGESDVLSVDKNDDIMRIHKINNHNNRPGKGSDKGNGKHK